MAAPFCPSEQAIIREALMDAAVRHACSNGMRRTTVDLLTTEVGISKGAFYHFFDSKEHLFLTMLERWYMDIARQSAGVYENHAVLPPAERAALMFKTAIGLMIGRPLVRFIREEVPVLLRRLSPETLAAHFTSVDDFILNLIHQAQIPLLIEESVAVAIIKTLIISIAYAEDIGASYEKALDLTIESVCSQLIGT